MRSGVVRKWLHYATPLSRAGLRRTAPFPDAKHLPPFSLHFSEGTPLEYTTPEASSCEEGSYAVGVLAHGSSDDELYGFQLLCRPNSPPSCPTPEGLLVGAHKQT